MTENRIDIANFIRSGQGIEYDYFDKEDLSESNLENITFDNNMTLPGTDCRFGDIVWDFNDKDSHRNYIACNFRIHWWSFFQELPLDIKKQPYYDPRIKGLPIPTLLLEDIKRYMYLYWRFGQVIGSLIHANHGRRTTTSTDGVGAISAITLTKAALRFFSYVILQEKIRHIEIVKLSDITIDHFCKYAPSCPYEFNIFLRKYFVGLASPIVSQNLIHKVQYDVADAKHLDWNNLAKQNKLNRKGDNKIGGSKKNNRTMDYDSWVPLHPEIFCWSSEAFRAVIYDFMEVFDLEKADRTPCPIKDILQSSNHESLISSCEVDVALAFNLIRDCNTCISNGEMTKVAAAYHARKTIILHTLKMQERNGNISEENRDLISKIEKGYYVSTFGFIKKLRNAIWNSRRAAMWLILQYTGMRWSDACTLTKPKNSSIVREINGFPVIVGSVVKNVPKEMPLNHDFWYAIPVVQDAVRVLEYTQSLTKTDYLFASWNSGAATGKPMHSGSFSRSIGVLLGQLDVYKHYFRIFQVIRNDGKVSNRYECILDGLSLHPHRLRHSLVAELARLEVGLPTISLQMKHAHNAFRQFNQVTFNYGGQTQTQMGKVRGTVDPSIYYEVTHKIPSAKQEIYNAYFDPNRNFAGGAAEEHTIRLKEFFGGKAWNDDQIRNYIKQLAESGAPLTVCGFGYCNDRQANGSDSEVCSGELCPPECENHLITETNAKQIEHRYIKCLQYLSSESFPLHKGKWRADAKRYEAYLKKLGIDVEAIRKTVLQMRLQE